MRFLSALFRDLVGLAGMGFILYGLYLSLGLPIVFYTGGAMALAVSILTGLSEARSEALAADRPELRLGDRTGSY